MSEAYHPTPDTAYTVNTSMRLADPNLRTIDAASVDHIRSAAERGCACPSRACALRRYFERGVLKVGLKCEGCGRNLTGALDARFFPFCADLPAWDHEISGRSSPARG
jgi:hypothetical protein